MKTTYVEKHLNLSGRQVRTIFTKKDVKRLSLRIKPDLVVYVSVPKGVSETTATGFVVNNAGFILKSIARFEKLNASSPKPVLFVDGEKTCVFGAIKTIKVIKDVKNQCEICGGEVVIRVKDVDNTAKKKKLFDKFVNSLVETVVTDYCKNYYDKFADRLKGFPELKFKKMTSKWGSCMPTENRLTFNYALINAPITCVEYVVAHEFTHYIEPNHSERFYNKLEKLLPDHRVRQRILKNVSYI